MAGLYVRWNTHRSRVMASKGPRPGEFAAKTTTTTVKGRKSRFGCSTCKSKRLKCDESRPSCKQCLRRDLVCPGYETRYRWSTRHERAPAREKSQALFIPEDEYTAFRCALPKVRSSDPMRTTWVYDECCSTELTSVLDSRANEGCHTVATTNTDTPMVNGDGIDHESQDDASQAPSTSGMYDVESAHPRVDDSFVELCGDTNGTDINETWLNDLISETWDSLVQPQDSQMSQSLTASGPSIPKFAAPVSIKYTPIHLPTVLVEHWFTDVCPMWSAFDSPNNRYRQLACTAWQQSEAVFYTLQSMSAAHLIDSLPHLKNAAAILSAQAVRSIQSEAQAAESGGRNELPTHLLLAIFAMGTSICWSDTRQLGLWFLEKAQKLLAQYATDISSLDEVSYKDLLHFREALVYWEMLSRVVGRDSRGTLKARREVYKERIRNALRRTNPSHSDESSSGRVPLPLDDKLRSPQELTLHPWTGVSTNVQHLFGLVMLLCRDNRTGNKQRGLRTTAGLSDALCNIELARDFEHGLQEINVSNPLNEDTPGLSQRDTGDSATPVSHLIDTAEAYRLASLLQLYQTFPELEVKNASSSLTTSSMTMTDMAYDDHHQEAQRECSLLRLTFQLVKCLQRIPAESGTRCIQPLLYISAASGLRFDTGIGQHAAAPLRNTVANNVFANTMSASLVGKQSLSLDVALLSNQSKLHDAARSDTNSLGLTDCTLEVSRARRFVVNRLHSLQRSLPPRPVGVALELVRATWARYDHNANASSDAHWIDVMIEKGLETLFG